MGQRAKWMGTAMLLSGVAPFLMATPVLAQTDTPENSSSQLEREQPLLDGDVVVTANRRSETVLSVPYNIQALSADTLAKIGATESADFARTIPGLSFIDRGKRTGIDIVLRGLRTGPISGSSLDRRTTSIYLDEVEIPGDLDPTLADIDRVEVLRGPQGTLYGSGAIGGTLRYITVKPDTNAFEGQLSGGVGFVEQGSVNYRANGMINIPLAEDVAALRVNIGQVYNSGYIDNVRLGAKNVNWDRTFSGRAALLIQPTPDFTINATYYVQLSDHGSDNLVAEDIGRFANDDYFPGREDSNTHLGNVTLSYDLGPAILTSSTSYRNERAVASRDITNEIRDVIFGSFVPPDLLPPFTARSIVNSHSETWTQEVRLVSDTDGPLSYVLGGYYNHSRSSGKQLEEVPIPYPGQDLIEEFITGAPIRDNQEYLISQDVTFRQYAFFGELGYRLTPRWRASIGGRYFDYHSSATNFVIDQYGFGGRNPDGTGRTVPLPSEYSYGLVDDSGAIFRFNTSYDIADRTLIYATVAQGYRPGGFNNVGLNTGITPEQRQFGPDKLTSYEVGLKGALLDNRLFLSGGIYYIDWSDIQTTVITPLGFAVTGNAGKASSRGFELEATLRNVPAQGVSIGLGFSHTDAKLDETIPLLGFDGEHVPYVPRNSGSLNIDYERTTGSGLTFGINTQLTYTGASFTDFGATKPNATGVAQPNQFYLRLDDYVLGQASLRLSKDGWTARFAVDNLFNTYAPLERTFRDTFSPYRDPFVNRRVNRPRTYTLTTSYRF